MKPRHFLYFLIPLILFLTALAYFRIADSRVDSPIGESFEIILPSNINWDSVEIGLTSILSDLIQIQTIRRNESQAAFYIQKILQKEGIKTQIIPHPDRPDKVSLLAEIGPKDSENGIVFLNHLDAVEANPSEWDIPPFAAIMKNGIIYGRGALDMKGMAAMELMAFIMIHRAKMPLANKVMFLSVPDEEDGGKYGTQFLLEQHEDIFDGYRYVLNEGGFGIKNFPHQGDKIFNIQTAEKGILGLELTAKGPSGHSSMPPAKYSSLNMVDFLNALKELNYFHPDNFHLTNQMVDFFSQLANFYEFPKNFLLKNIQNPLVQNLLSDKLTQIKSINAMVTNTIAITNLSTTNFEHNVIPSETKAYLNIRTLPGVNPKNIATQVQKLAKSYDINVDIKESYSSTQSSSKTQLYDILYSVLHDNVPDAVITPYLSPGATDNRFFREKGFQCYGVIPIMLSMKDLEMLHGKNESISLENLKLGTKILFETLVGFNQVTVQ